MESKTRIEECPCFCGDSSFQKIIENSKLTVCRCAGCRSLRVDHYAQSDQKPWSVESLDEFFLQALKRRRDIQARKIISSWFVQSGSRVVDYGCGQGSFVGHLHAAKIDALGCDLDAKNFSKESGARFYQLPAPWFVPDQTMIGPKDSAVLLDVIEHASRPDVLLAEISQRLGVSSIVIKTPDLDGPIGRLGFWLAWFGKPSLLESLVLVGDPAPHLWYFTKKGLDQLMYRIGYKRIDQIGLAEVGIELRNRVRNPAIRRLVPRFGWKMIGIVFEKMGNTWSEALCAKYTRI